MINDDVMLDVSISLRRDGVLIVTVKSDPEIPFSLHTTLVMGMLQRYLITFKEDAK